MTLDRIARLTEQQRVCLRLVYAHMTSKEIAPKLGIEPNSVDQHIKAAMRTLGVSDRRTAAIMLAEFENRTDYAEMREVQADFAAQPSPDMGAFAAQRSKSRWWRRALMLVATLLALAFLIGVILAAVEAWRKVFEI